MIKYKLQSRLGPVKIPSQKKIFPISLLPRKSRVRLSETNGNWVIWRKSRYPRRRRKMHSMINSCTQADSRKVIKLAETWERRNELMELW
jgi:hypothetical protein